MYDIILIGTSAGGTEALTSIFSLLPRKINTPIAIVQHINYQAESKFISYFKSCCNVPIDFAEDGENIKKNRIYIAPPNYHMLLEYDKSISLNLDKKTAFSRPSIDELFFSASDLYKEKVLAIILTGSNSDGTAGAQYVKNNGGLVIVQSPESCKYPYMPNSVIQSGHYHKVLDLSKIAKFILQQSTLNKNG